ncbi:hypothetical protein, partial [Acidiphilium sp.]|uniref:hypothetical protein n=1 Tax=Acidiphilium sp. TaxID=527 RepID=UPI0025825978
PPFANRRRRPCVIQPLGGGHANVAAKPEPVRGLAPSWGPPTTTGAEAKSGSTWADRLDGSPPSVVEQ